MNLYPLLSFGSALARASAITAFSLACLTSVAAPEENTITATLANRIKANVEANTKGDVVPKTVRSTPIDGLFEVTTKGMDLFYVDKTGRYGLVDGRLVDMRDKKDLTMARIEELRSIDFNKLPLHLAIKRGNGSKVLAVFEDPACPVCRPLHKFLTQIPDLTIYHFPLPVTSSASVPIAAAAWCSSDRVQAWDRAMNSGGVPPKVKPTCDLSDLEQIAKVAEALNVEGTPTMFLSNGRRMQGALPPDVLLEAIQSTAPSNEQQAGRDKQR